MHYYIITIIKPVALSFHLVCSTAYPPSCRATPTCGQYQIIPVGDRGIPVCVCERLAVTTWNWNNRK